MSLTKSGFKLGPVLVLAFMLVSCARAFAAPKVQLVHDESAMRVDISYGDDPITSYHYGPGFVNKPIMHPIYRPGGGPGEVAVDYGCGLRSPSFSY